MFACIHCPGISEDVALTDFGYSFSPLIEETAPDCVVLDVAGCELRFGSAYQLANEIAAYATRPRAVGGLGQRINVSLAGNPDAAILAARFLKGITFITPGEELTALGDLPIDRLLISKSQPTPKFKVQNPSSEVSSPKSQVSSANKQTLDIGLWTLDVRLAEEILETFRLWGVRTFRDLAELPTIGIAERLGQTGVKLQQLAAGKTERHLQLKQPAPSFENMIELEYPVTELEPLSFIFARLLNQLCASLFAYALATNELQVHLKLEDGTSHERTLSLPTPLRDHKTFLKLLLLDTEAHPPQQGVVAVAIACEPVKPRVLQSGLFIPQAPEPAKLELTLARLAKLVGAKNVGSPEVIDTHRPDAFQVKKFEVATERKTRRRRDGEKGIRGDGETGRQGEGETGRQGEGEKGRQGDGEMRGNGDDHHPLSVSPRLPLTASLHAPVSLGFRMFRPPLRAMVDASRGYPQQISAWGPNRSVYGKVVRLSGPWRKTGDWWRVDCWARDEWDVAVEQSGAATGGHKSTQVLYRIYRELHSGAWFVEGSYD